MDIETALAEETQAPSARGRCKIQRWLGTLDPDQPGFVRLAETIDTPFDPRDPATRTLQQTARILGRLGLSTTYLAVGNHRAGRCRCGD